MSAATPVGDVVKIVAGLVQLIASPNGQQLVAKWFLDAGLTEASVNGHVAEMERSAPPKKATDGV
jgi:hypothetical protein